MLAVESHTPVVTGTPGQRGRPSAASGPRVSVRFGTPLNVSPGTSYIDATQQIETAEKGLQSTSEGGLCMVRDTEHW